MCILQKHWKIVTNLGDPATRHILPPQGIQGKLDPVLPAAHNACEGSAKMAQVRFWGKCMHYLLQCLENKLQK